ncbi:hypothetical protein FIU46_16480, partial [Enterococcus faecium]
MFFYYSTLSDSRFKTLQQNRSIDTKETTANIFVDNSIIEIFINKG